MATVTERTFWIVWLKKQYLAQVKKALTAISADEQKKIVAKAKAAWARENGVTAELKRLEGLRLESEAVNRKAAEINKEIDKLHDGVADAKDIYARYQAESFMREHKEAGEKAIQSEALKRAKIDSLDLDSIEAVIMAATTSQQLMNAVSKLAAALGVEAPSIE